MKYFLFTGTRRPDMYRITNRRRDAVAKFDTALALKEYLNQKIIPAYIDPSIYIAIAVDFQSRGIDNIKLIYNKDSEVPNILYISGVFSDADEPGEENTWTIRSEGVDENYHDFIDAILEFENREIDYGDLAFATESQLLYHGKVIVSNLDIAEAKRAIIPKAI